MQSLATASEPPCRPRTRRPKGPWISGRELKKQGRALRPAGTYRSDPQTDHGQQGLNPLPKIFKNHVPDQSGNDGNAKVGDRENIVNGENQALSLAIRPSKLPHQ
jgi:hypothetical protein